MAVTRIKNNQITDSTITFQKIAPGTLVGSLFNANLTLNSNVNINGNLSIAGNTTTINSIDTLVSDSLITLNNGYVGIPSYDVGILFNRALGTLDNYGGVNAALVWSESDGAFIAVLTTETGTTAGTINRAFRANMIVGNLTVSNAVTAQRATITNLNATNTNLSGLTSTGNIVAASGQNATNYTTGAIVVPGGGGVGITGDLWVQGPSTFAGNIVAGNIVLSGNINVPVGGTFSNTGVFFGNAGGIGALYAGTTTYTALPTTVLQLSANIDTYAQLNFQNINSGTSASTDLVLTADNGNDTDGFINLGIDSSTYNDLPGFYPNDGYLIHHSALSTGNIVIVSHTEGSAIKLHVGDYGDANVRVTVTNNGLRVNTTTTSTSTTSGALLVDGGLGVAGNIHAAAINNTPIGNTTPSTGSFTDLTGTYLTASTGLSTANAVVTGGYIQNLSNISATDGSITTLVATNVSTANAVISGGYINNLSNLTATTTQTTNFSTANAVVTGGYIDNTPIGPNTASTGNFTTANATSIEAYTITAANINSTNGNITTVTASNVGTSSLYTGNIVVTGTSGNISGVDVVSANTFVFSANGVNILTSVQTNIDALDANVGAYQIYANANIGTLFLGNISTNANLGAYQIYANANAASQQTQIDNIVSQANANTAAYLTIYTGNINADIISVNVVNTNSGNITTLVANNFSSANVRIAGGDISNVNAQINNFSTANALITGGVLNNINVQANNFSTANAVVTGGYAQGLANVTATDGDFTTLVADNFSTANAIITGGNITILTPSGSTIPNSYVQADRVEAYFGNFANLTASNVDLDGNFTGNVVSSNAELTGGYIDAIIIGANTATAGTFTQLNAVDSTLTGNLNITSGVESISTSTGAIVVVGGAGISGNVFIGGNLTVLGNTTTLNTESLNVEDLNITVAANATSGAQADGAGLTVAGANATLTYVNALDSWQVNKNLSGFQITMFQANLTNANITNITSASIDVPALNATYANITNGNIINLNSTSGNITTLVANNFSSANVRIASGWIDDTKIGPNVASTGNFTTANTNILTAYTANATSLNVTNGNVTILGADNFSTANAVVTGGYINNLANLTATTAQATNFSTANALIIGGVLNNINVQANNFSSGNVVVTGGYINNLSNLTATTTQTTNFSTANALITGGVLNNINVQANNFNTANAVITGGYINDLANLTATTTHATNFSTANALITGGYIDGTQINPFNANTGNFTTANATSVTAYSITGTQVNTTNGNATTLVATNFSTGNAVITGGSVDAVAIGATTAGTGNFTTANATTVTAYNATVTDLNSTNGNVTTLVATNFSSGNVVISGGYISALTNAYVTTSNIVNFSTANARISGGYIDGTPIGANTRAAGNFTNLDASGLTQTATLNVTANVYLSPQSGVATVTINPLIGGTIDSMAIGQTNASNVYASNFRTSTSLWAATTGPVWIRGGTGTSGINNIPIGAVTPSSGIFTTLDGQTLTGTTVNATNGNVTTLVATNFSSGNAVISGGYISALSNAYITLSQIANFSTANARITGGFADNFPIGANTAAPGAFTTLTAASLNSTIIGNATPAAGTFTALTATGNLTLATGNIVISSGNTTVYTAAAGTANTTGALVITGIGGAAINGNVYIGQGAVINGNRTTNDTIVRGVNERSLVYVAADATYDQVSIGGNITTSNIIQGAKLVVNSTDSLIIPVGTTAQRPSGQGFTDVEGMVRFNTTTGELEFYGGGQWNITGAVFTVIQSRVFANVSGDVYGNVDGTNTEFTLGSESTTSATIVSINGVIQIPTTAYSVTGNVVTFTEAPAVGDVVDTRVLTTTGTVTGVTSLNGFNQFQADSTGLRFYTGNVSLGSIENWRLDTHGDFYPVTSANLGTPTNRVDYIYASNINIQGGTITGAGLSQGSLDDTIIGANVARLGSFTTLFANDAFTTNAEHITDDIRGKFVSPGGTDAVFGWDISKYRSGKFFVQLSSASEYQATEIISIHDGTTCSIETYGVTFTGAANLATFSCNIAGGTAYLNASSAGANLAIKVTPTLMKL